MDRLNIIVLLLVIGVVSLFLSRRWLNRNRKLTGADFASGFSKARAMALQFIGFCCLVLAILIAVKLI